MPKKDCCEVNETCEKYRYDTTDCKKPIKKIHTDYYHTTHIQPVKYVSRQKHNVTRIYEPIVKEECYTPTNECIYVPHSKEEKKCEQKEEKKCEQKEEKKCEHKEESEPETNDCEEEECPKKKCYSSKKKCYSPKPKYCCDCHCHCIKKKSYGDRKAQLKWWLNGQ